MLAPIGSAMATPALAGLFSARGMTSLQMSGRPAQNAGDLPSGGWGGEAKAHSRDPTPTNLDPNDPKAKQTHIPSGESFAEYMARRGGGAPAAPAPAAPAPAAPAAGGGGLFSDYMAGRGGAAPAAPAAPAPVSSYSPPPSYGGGGRPYSKYDSTGAPPRRTMDAHELPYGGSGLPSAPQASAPAAPAMPYAPAPAAAPAPSYAPAPQAYAPPPPSGARPAQDAGDLPSGGWGGEAKAHSRDPTPTALDPNDPKAKQTHIPQGDSFEAYMARRR